MGLDKKVIKRENRRWKVRKIEAWLIGLEFGVKIDNMTRDNGLCECVVKPHGVSDKPLGEAILYGSEGMCSIVRLNSSVEELWVVYLPC
jgi:hypothetical protein